MMLLVPDTNILVSGIIWAGTPRKIIHAALDGRIDLASSSRLLAELRRVLSYDRIALTLRRKGKTADELMAFLSGLVILVDVPRLLNPVCRDPDDDEVLACAQACAADAIVSGDHDLLMLGAFEGCPILSAAAAVSTIPT